MGWVLPSETLTCSRHRPTLHLTETRFRTVIGELISRYRILEQIGAGGMGVVYRAHDERLDRDVALKVLPPHSLADLVSRRRFRKEALTLSKLNHSNIAMVFDFDTQGETDFLVTEYIPGVTLDSRLNLGHMSEGEVLKLGIQLAAGLEAAHGRGIVHRDLKPRNLRTSSVQAPIANQRITAIRKLSTTWYCH